MNGRRKNGGKGPIAISNNEISAEKIELINAYGPYDHSIWITNNLEITNKGLLRRRSEFLLECVKNSIFNYFTLAEISSFSILDVGCYDGWLLHQLSELPFQRLVGLDPREKNIIKGQKIRELLNIESRAEFRVGDIESLGEEKFDIVMCCGVLHHLESPSHAIRQLKSVCRRMLFVETICLSSQYMTKAFRKEIEMKDLVYFYKDKTCGIVGQKFESSYYDGSTDKPCIVSIPSVESLLMYFDMYGLKNREIVADSKVYKAAVCKNDRPFNAVCLCVLVNQDTQQNTSDELSWIKDYETKLAETIIDIRYIEPLYKFFHLKRFDLRRPLFFISVLLYIYAPKRLSSVFLYTHKLWIADKYALEIIKNLKFNPEDKLGLEYGKILYTRKEYKKAISVLQAVTQKVNADWRSVYRSFYILSQIYKDIGLMDESRRYEKLCVISNPKFPIQRSSEETRVR